MMTCLRMPLFLFTLLLLTTGSFFTVTLDHDLTEQEKAQLEQLWFNKPVKYAGGGALSIVAIETVGSLWFNKGIPDLETFISTATLGALIGLAIDRGLAWKKNKQIKSALAASTSASKKDKASEDERSKKGATPKNLKRKTAEPLTVTTTKKPKKVPNEPIRRDPGREYDCAWL